MPDTHQGYGMPIGGVIATRGVIIPNAVGVDIGCFSGDTKIPLLDGTQKTLKELTEDRKEIYVYSLNENLDLVPGKAVSKMTRKNAELMEIVISGGEVIRCTPDHKFMLVSGLYREAKDLTIFDSLMPLYRSYQTRDGYERIRTISGNGVMTHQMVAIHFLGKRKETDLVHHKDENWYNNDPINLEYKNIKLHSKEHAIKNNKFRTEEFKNKRLLKLQERGFYAPEFKEKKKKIAVENIERYNDSDKKKEQDKLAGQRGKKYLVKYNKSEKGRTKSSEIGKKFGFGRFNHKVLSIRRLDKKENVYCLTVEKYHNFALSSGVFVHNCGMCSVKTSLTEISTETLKKILGKIRERIPLGFNKHEDPQDIDLMPNGMMEQVVDREFLNARKSLGTLGGGNHFIEIQKDDEGHIWIMVHSGSRNLGKQVADFYNKKAVEINERYFSRIPKEWELAFLPMDSEDGRAYLKEMEYCVEFALANRRLMMDRIKVIFCEETGGHPNESFASMINIAHNYATMENHFGTNVLVHRKGATRAKLGELGIIPGSQGTSSYIIRGKGNEESFMSCSHGAGRKMGRKQAERTLNLEEEKKKLDDKGILHAIRGASDLDEASGAYKPIEVVMEEQKDLVDIIVRLEPLAVIKG
jgi:tRNA-splicing ligase RtcB